MSLSVAVFILRPLSLNNNFFLLQTIWDSCKIFSSPVRHRKIPGSDKRKFWIISKGKVFRAKRKKTLFHLLFHNNRLHKFSTPAHPRLLIKSIPYRQAFCLQNICAKTSELSKNLLVLKESFIN